MRSLFRNVILCMVLVVLSGGIATCGDATPDTVASVSDQPQLTQQHSPASFLSNMKFGMDTYVGRSNMPQMHRFTDGMWAGNCAVYPSIAYLQWDGNGEQSAKLSIGTGDLYTDADVAVKQPVEAYWQGSLGNAAITVGKFWVPFAQQEWLYAPQWGMSARWDGARSSLSVSFNHNSNLNRPNTYIRGAYKLTNDTELGISYGLGQGFCADSIHNRGIALDTTINYAGWRLYGEYNHFKADQPGNDFKYISGKLYYDKLGVWAPFVGRFSWHDDSQTFGNFRSCVYGVDYQLSPSFCLEAAVAPTSDKRVSWIEFHWAWEMPISHK